MIDDVLTILYFVFVGLKCRSLSITEFYRVLPSFTEFYRVWRGAGAAAGARAPTAAAATTTATASRRHCWPPTSPQPTPWSPRIRASTVKSGTQPDFLVLPNFT